MEYLDVSSVQNIKALSALLSSQQEEENDEDYQVSIFSHVNLKLFFSWCLKSFSHSKYFQDASPYAKMGPGHIGPPTKKEKEGTVQLLTYFSSRKKTRIMHLTSCVCAF